MKTRMFWTFALAACLVGCGKQPPAEEAAVEPAAEEPAAVVEEAPAEPVAVEPEAVEPKFGQEFLDHMHAHAERVDELMYALDDGDLDEAKAAASWLTQHKTEVIEYLQHETEFPLTFDQERLWFLDQLEPGSAFYNTPYSFRLHGQLNPTALEQSLIERPSLQGRRAP